MKIIVRVWDGKNKKMITENFSVSYSGIPHNVIGPLGADMHVMLFIGIHDKDENKVFAGDVVLYKGKRGTIDYFEGWCAFVVKYDDGDVRFLDRFYAFQLEVIGNIYEGLKFDLIKDLKEFEKICDANEVKKNENYEVRNLG